MSNLRCNWLQSLFGLEIVEVRYSWQFGILPVVPSFPHVLAGIQFCGNCCRLNSVQPLDSHPSTKTFENKLSQRRCRVRAYGGIIFLLQTVDFLVGRASRTIFLGEIFGPIRLRHRTMAMVRGSRALLLPLRGSRTL